MNKKVIAFCMVLVISTSSWAGDVWIGEGWHLVGFSEGIDTSKIPSSCYSSIWEYSSSQWKKHTANETGIIDPYHVIGIP